MTITDQNESRAYAVEDIATRLLHAIMQFRRFNGKQHNIGGLTRGEMMILFCVDEGTEAGITGLKISEISNRLMIASPTVTQQVNGLENQGYVERCPDPDDRRIVRVRVTPEGNLIITKVKSTFLAAFEGLVEHLGEEDSKQLAGLLERATEYFASLREPGSPQAE